MVDGADDGDEEAEGEPSGSAQGARAGGAGGGAPVRSDPVFPVSIDVASTPLPACEPGFLPSGAARRECTYMFRDRCYEESLQACACACSGRQASRCIIGGFLNPDEPQTVSCIAR
jgi:hypothetical protein